MATAIISDPTRDEMLDTLVGEADEFSVEAAIYWFASDCHGGQWSNLYAALSQSPYRPGQLERGCPDDAKECYEALEERFAKPNPNTYVEIGAAYWASYLINGDASGMSDEERRLADAWLARVGGEVVDCGEPFFTWSYGLHTGADCAGGDVVEYTIRGGL
jgi:hypothetical protein